MLRKPRRLARKYLSSRGIQPLRTLRRESSAGGGTPVISADRGADRGTGSDALLVELRQGGSVTADIVTGVRDLITAEDITGATSVAAALVRDSGTKDLGDVCMGIVSAHRGFSELAWHHFSSVPLGLWARHAAFEYVRAGFAEDEEAVLRSVRALVAEAPAFMNAKRWMDVVGPVFGAGNPELVDELMVALDRTMAEQEVVSESAVVRRDWFRRWIHRSPSSPSAPSSGADVSFAIMDYDHPSRGRASANIGDHVQTLASLGHLVRYENVTFQGPQDLLELVTQLQSRVRPERRRAGHAATVQVLTVNRDATMYDEVPEGTWTLAFGWYMHPLFGLRYGLPFHKNLQPIFISFHCNKRSLLTPETIDYLRQCGPIGCRDWTTVDILLSVDVPAFFSGCLTTTVDTVFRERVDAFPESAPVAYVDAASAAPPDAVTYAHSSDEVRFRSFTDNMFEAMELLETYRRDHSAVVTSRLHCYLPMRSLGASVDFRPKSRSDIRFAGLIDITQEQFEAIRTGINDRLERVLGAILDGGSRDEVYDLWRELCAPDVEVARRRLAAPADHGPASDISDAIRRAIAGSRTVGTTTRDAVHVAVRVGDEDTQVLDVLLDSLKENSSSALHVWLLDRTARGIDLDALASHDRTSITLVPVRGLGADLQGLAELGRTHPRAGFELLMLPELLPDVARVVVVPWAALVKRDVVELAELDLAGQAIAAPEVAGRPDASGFGVIHNAGHRLDARTSAATELRRSAHARHTFDFQAFDTSVLVLDLQRLRDEGMVTEAARLVEEFDLTAREALHFLVGPHRADIPPEWHAVPTRNQVSRPALVHWDDAAKPWTADYAPLQEQWHARRRQMRQRIAATP